MKAALMSNAASQTEKQPEMATDTALSDITPVLLAGGQGTRLWPLTSLSRPKPLLKLQGGQSFLQATLERCKGLASPVVITEERIEPKIEQALLRANCDGGTIISEPVGRSTASALALAAFSLRAANKPMVVMPTDHWLAEPEKLTQALASSVSLLSVGTDAVIFGVKPTADIRRYGHISVAGGGPVYDVSSFVEKPSRATLNELKALGVYFWNSGIFLMRPEKYLLLLQRFAPDVFDAANKAFRNGIREKRATLRVISAQCQAYEKSPHASVDHAVMERMQKAKLVALETPWRDVGTWKEFLRLKFYHRA